MEETPAAASPSVDLQQYVRVLLRRWPVMVVVFAVTVGLVWVYTQGAYDTRLHYFTELPAGSLLVHLESATDAARAKQVLGGSQCIEGNVSNSLLATGSVEEVEAECRELVEACAPGGGFMMDFSAFLDEAKPENVKAMIEVAR